MAFLGIHLAAALLLAGAGAAKLLAPGDLATALARVTRRPADPVRTVVRVLAAGECALGVAAIVHPSTATAAPVAVSYLAFAVYVAWLRRTGGPLATCGCFGTPDTPATGAHVAVDLVFAIAAAAVAASTGDWLPALLDGQPGRGWPLLLAAGTAAFLAYAVLSPLARLAGARRLYRKAAA